MEQTNLCARAAALPDPVAQPPVTESDAAGGGEEEEGVDDEDDWASCCFDVGAVHRPADLARALLFRLHQWFCIGKEE